MERAIEDSDVVAMVIDSRVGIVIDQCYKQTYEHFDLPPPGAKKTGP